MLLYVLAVFACCFLLERLKPGWRLPQVPTWTQRVLAVNAVQLGVVLLAGVSWERWLAGRSAFALSSWVGPVTGGLIAYFIATFVFYWWHRWRHEFDFLWLGFHQIHHSPQRLEVITSFYKHPGEMLVNSIIGSLLVYSLLGLSPEAGAVYTACTALGEFFYHTNVTTPRWVGWFFQRPEMHRIHHQHGRHKNNYGDITWWDMLFGTYENPAVFSATCGFDDHKEQRLRDMLLYRDAHQATPESKPLKSGGTPPLMAQRQWQVFSLACVSVSGAQSCPKEESLMDSADSLKSGDIVFIATKGFLFRRVARATGSRASHVGIAFNDAQRGWLVAESAIPRSRYSLLERFLARSDQRWFVVRRLGRELTAAEVQRLRAACDARMGQWYHTGFKYDSPRLFCSKFVHEVYREALGLDIGTVETFSELLHRNPEEKLGFWKWWFFGRIPWTRRTITPASQLQSPMLRTVVESTSGPANGRDSLAA